MTRMPAPSSRCVVTAGYGLAVVRAAVLLGLCGQTDDNACRAVARMVGMRYVASVLALACAPPGRRWVLRSQTVSARISVTASRSGGHCADDLSAARPIAATVCCGLLCAATAVVARRG
ncbi:hypothetical protein ACQP0C_21560 [Nocardia sp. CA-129566]|uniref:hypothetical protein n=1 Tax=Nocardia sp. CA-129566 TaxID=3239976 RepID=UPI003D99BE2B